MALTAPLADARRPPPPRAHASIIGAKIANPASWGFTVLVLDRGKPACAGSVIAPTRVLTAAHCALVPASQLAVVANRPRLFDTSAGQVIGVSAAHVHPDFVTAGLHDLAVLDLGTATTAPSIPLADSVETDAATFPGALLRVAGWGARKPSGRRFPKVLMDVAEKARHPRRCKRAYFEFFAAQSMICALGRNIRHTAFHRTACVGDSGGPLVADLPSGPRLVGVVSFGGGSLFSPLCGFRKLPSVYAKVADGRAFIQANIPPP